MIGFFVGHGRYVELGIVGLLGSALLVAVRPVWGAVGVLGFAFVNPSILPPLGEVGEFTFRMPDALAMALAIGVFFRVCFAGGLRHQAEWWTVFRSLVPFLLYVGLSLSATAMYVPSALAGAVASYARLVATVLYGWLLYMALRGPGELKLIMRFFVLAALATIGIGIQQFWSGVEPVGPLEGRFGGFLGLNTFGLVAGLLVLYGFVSRKAGEPLLYWVIFVASGSIGLILSKSGSSTFATFGTVALVWAASGREGLRGIRLWRLAVVGTFAIVGAVSAVSVLRGTDLAGLLTLTGGSWAQRAMIAYGGLQIFVDHPVLGVGWQASSTEAFIGDPGLNALLMSSFAELPSNYFFLEHITSLHNMYIQLLAELGLVGFALFAYGVYRAGKRVARILGRIPDQSPYMKWAVFCAFGLVYLLIWWNTNPLYGGQTESVLAFTFLAVFAALWRLEKRRTVGVRRRDSAPLQDEGTERV